MPEGGSTLATMAARKVGHSFKVVSKTNYKVHDFISWQRNKSLTLSPSFQRRSVWSPKAKSYLMDTIIKGLPVPIIFIREVTDLHTLEPKREIVDGQQRLRTIISFVEGKLLKDFRPDADAFTIHKTHNKELAGKEFAQLPPDVRQNILNYEFSAHILSADTEDSEVLQIFARMNSTGVKLNEQELRNAEFFGVFKTFIYDLSYEKLQVWRKWHTFNEVDIARMQEVEEASDWVYLMLNGLKGRSQPALNKLYRDHEDSFPQAASVRSRFEAVVERIDQAAGDIIKDTQFKKRALMNTLFTYAYDKMFGLGSDLNNAKPKTNLPRLRDIVTEASQRIRDQDLSEIELKVLRGATGNLESRKIRLKFLNGLG